MTAHDVDTSDETATATSELAVDTRRALVQLLKGPLITAAKHPDVWRTVLRDEKILRSRVADVFLDLVVDDENQLAWQTDALCAQTDPEAFFPEKGGSTREAKKVCARCEVRAECLEYALAHDERFGIWGGLSERERRKLKKRAV